MIQTSFRKAMLGVVLATIGLLGMTDRAEAGSYSKMYYGKSYNYRYYSYYSKKYGESRRHMLVYHPRQPRYVYYYNTDTGLYWGRFDLSDNSYQLLADKDKKPTIGEIPDEAFPKGGKMPPPEPGLEPMPLPPEGQQEPEPPSKPTIRLPSQSSGGCQKGR